MTPPFTATSPRFAVDVAPVRAQPAGVGLYVALLVRALVLRNPNDVVLTGLRPEANALRDIHARGRVVDSRWSPFHVWMQLAADRAARSMGVRLVHYTNAAAPLIPRLPYVLTVHDLSVMRMPGSHPRRRRLIVPLNLAAIARARQIIVPSRWTARELARIGVSPRRVTVIPHAPTLDPTDADRDAAARLGLAPGGYVLFVGTLEPRKNIERLVAAFELLAVDRPDLRLVLVGAAGWLSSGIEDRIDASPFRERIVRPGYLDGRDVAGLIADCGAFAYVSLYEGFGMPVLDALAFGVPVVTSRTTSMPEAGGDAAVLADPRDPADIARALTSAMQHRAELSTLGPARANQRSWDDVAAAHLDVYEYALDLAERRRH